MNSAIRQRNRLGPDLTLVPCCHPSSSSQWQSIGQAKSNSRMWQIWTLKAICVQLKDCWSQIHPEASRSTSISKRSLILAIALFEYGEMQESEMVFQDPEKFTVDMRSALRAILLHTLSDIFSYAYRINMFQVFLLFHRSRFALRAAKVQVRLC